MCGRGGDDARHRHVWQCSPTPSTFASAHLCSTSLVLSVRECHLYRVMAVPRGPGAVQACWDWEPSHNALLPPRARHPPCDPPPGRAINIVMSSVVTRAVKYIVGHTAPVNAIVALEADGYMATAGVGTWVLDRKAHTRAGQAPKHRSHAAGVWGSWPPASRERVHSNAPPPACLHGRRPVHQGVGHPEGPPCRHHPDHHPWRWPLGPCLRPSCPAKQAPVLCGCRCKGMCTCVGWGVGWSWGQEYGCVFVFFWCPWVAGRAVAVVWAGAAVGKGFAQARVSPKYETVLCAPCVARALGVNPSYLKTLWTFEWHHPLRDSGARFRSPSYPSPPTLSHPPPPPSSRSSYGAAWGMPSPPPSP